MGTKDVTEYYQELSKWAKSNCIINGHRISRLRGIGTSRCFALSHSHDLVVPLSICKLNLHNYLIEKLTEKNLPLGEKLTENKLSILRLMMDEPYTSRTEMADVLGTSETSVCRNIETMYNNHLRRVGTDKSGYWEIIRPKS